jgi:hypothetical protein
VLIACSTGGNDKPSPLVIGIRKSLHCFKNVKPANTYSWMTTMVFEDDSRTLV